MASSLHRQFVKLTSVCAKYVPQHYAAPLAAPHTGLQHALQALVCAHRRQLIRQLCEHRLAPGGKQLLAEHLCSEGFDTSLPAVLKVPRAGGCSSAPERPDPAKPHSEPDAAPPALAQTSPQHA